MKKPYKIVSGASTPDTPDRRELADWLAKDGQLLLPLVELLEKGERAIDEVIDVMGRATIEAVLRMSAEQVAGPKEQGRRDADRELYWHGVQAGRVALKERQLRVDKPRLRKKRPRADEPGEVEIPAYAALQANRPLADRMLEVVLQGVSTRKYETVLPALADQVGVSKSEVSRETIEAGTRVLKEMAERDLNELDVLVVYLDGIVFGDYHVLAAVGVDADGRKHVLGLCGGASENTEVTAGLLEDLVARGLRSDRRRLFVIDGAKALRAAIGRVFGSSNLVQRCRNHYADEPLAELLGIAARCGFLPTCRACCLWVADSGSGATGPTSSERLRHATSTCSRPALRDTGRCLMPVMPWEGQVPATRWLCHNKTQELVGSEGDDAEHAMAHHLAGATDSNMAATEFVLESAIDALTRRAFLVPDLFGKLKADAP